MCEWKCTRSALNQRKCPKNSGGACPQTPLLYGSTQHDGASPHLIYHLLNFAPPKLNSWMKPWLLVRIDLQLHIPWYYVTNDRLQVTIGRSIPAGTHSLETLQVHVCVMYIQVTYIFSGRSGHFNPRLREECTRAKHEDDVDYRMYRVFSDMVECFRRWQVVTQPSNRIGPGRPTASNVTPHSQ